jgi:hypothetical protein
MSLPGRQQRVINQIEGALCASEPQLAAMFAVFARLSEDQPVAAEPLTGSLRRRWLAPGNAMYAILLVPVMFIAVIIGAVLGGSARNTATCDVGYSAGGAPALDRALCPAEAKSTVRLATSGTMSAPCAAAAASPADPAAEPAPGAPFVIQTASEQALSLPSHPEATTKDPARVC